MYKQQQQQQQKVCVGGKGSIKAEDGHSVLDNITWGSVKLNFFLSVANGDTIDIKVKPS